MGHKACRVTGSARQSMWTCYLVSVCTGSQRPKQPAGDIPLTGKPPVILLQRSVHGRPLWLFASGRYQGLAWQVLQQRASA